MSPAPTAVDSAPPVVLPLAVDADVVELDACADVVAALATVESDAESSVAETVVVVVLALVLLLLLLLLLALVAAELELADTAFTTRSTGSVSGLDELGEPFELLPLAAPLPFVVNVTTVLAVEPFV